MNISKKYKDYVRWFFILLFSMSAGVYLYRGEWLIAVLCFTIAILRYVNMLVERENDELREKFTEYLKTPLTLNMLVNPDGTVTVKESPPNMTVTIEATEDTVMIEATVTMEDSRSNCE
jgi:hypothetical protein